MKSIFVLCSLFVSLSAFAQETRMPMPQPEEPPPVLQLYPVGQDVRIERGASQDYEARNFWNFSFAYKTPVMSALVEYGQFEDQSGNSTSNIDRTHQEMMLWGRWHFFRRTTTSFHWSVYGGLGVGAYKEQVKTTVLGDSHTDDTGTKIMSGVSVGTEASYYFTKNFAVVGALEGRGLFAGDFDPNPTGSGVVRIGIELPL